MHRPTAATRCAACAARLGITGALLGLASAVSQAQGLEPLPSTPASPSASPSASTSASTPASPPAPASLSPSQVRLRTAAVIAGTVGGTLAYGQAKWWQDGLTGEFRTVNEGWFGQGTANGGADKLGHAMFAYAGTRLLARGLEWAGNDRETALRLGAVTAVGTLLAVEAIDGFSREWRFSREDAVADLVGGALGYLMETHPRLDALLDLRLQYSPSEGPGRSRSFDPFGDYSGQRYLLVLKASGVPALREHPLLRYLELNVGYGTRNFEKESRPFVEPTRHAYVGVALNLTEVLRGTAFRGNDTPSRTQRLTETALEFVQVPPATLQRDRVIR